MIKNLATLFFAGLVVSNSSNLFAQEMPSGLKSRAIIIKCKAMIESSLNASPLNNFGLSENTNRDSKNNDSDDSKESDKKREERSEEDAQIWTKETFKATLPGSPASFRIRGKNITVLVYITVFNIEESNKIKVLTQTQIWYLNNDKSKMSYKTTISTIDSTYGQSFLFFPLGVDENGKSQLKLDIFVDKASNLKFYLEETKRKK